MKTEKKHHLGFQDYMKAIRKADREVELMHTQGFKAGAKIHPSKKTYNRKEGKRIKPDDLPFFFCIIGWHCSFYLH